jgi:hypothetical protein
MKLYISFSGGKTSAFMTRWLLDNKRDDYTDIVILFANTGQENEETLRFVERCDKEWGLGVVWVEAVINPEKGKGTRHRVVNYETASRAGEPFEDAIKKFGIPNQAAPFCTRELKKSSMTSYLRSLGWKKGDYQTAIGIRFDEVDRVNSNMVKEKIIYPLIEDIKVTKEMIAAYWRSQSFTLNLREHEGNCSWCYKKSLRKLLTLAQDTPEIFDFPIRMERLYGNSDKSVPSENRLFFRGMRGGLDILEESKTPFRKWEEPRESMDMFGFEMEMDSANGCSESCEVF